MDEASIKEDLQKNADNELKIQLLKTKKKIKRYKILCSVVCISTIIIIVLQFLNIVKNHNIYQSLFTLIIESALIYGVLRNNKICIIGFAFINAYIAKNCFVLFFTSGGLFFIIIPLLLIWFSITGVIASLHNTKTLKNKPD